MEAERAGARVLRKGGEAPGALLACAWGLKSRRLGRGHPALRLPAPGEPSGLCEAEGLRFHLEAGRWAPLWSPIGDRTLVQGHTHLFAQHPARPPVRRQAPSLYQRHDLWLVWVPSPPGLVLTHSPRSRSPPAVPKHRVEAECGFCGPPRGSLTCLRGALQWLPADCTALPLLARAA